MADNSWHNKIGDIEFPAESDRYHMYIGWFCPFAHRATLARELKGLQSFVSISSVKPYPKEDGGWRFPSDKEEYTGSAPNPYHPEDKFLHDVYFRSPPNYKEYEGIYSVPVLWDTKTNQIVNNESLEIMRNFNHAFDNLLPEDSQHRARDLYPEHLRKQIDEIDSWLIPNLNSGVYKAGFAEDQATYEENAQIVFANLDRLEKLLAEHGKPFILPQQLTDLDLKAYATLIRFDIVYHQHFKLNIRSIRHDYPAIHRYVKNLYWNYPGFKETTNFKHIKENYTKSHPGINPRAITPLGPLPEVEAWTEKDAEWKKSWQNDVEWPVTNDWRQGRTLV